MGQVRQTTLAREDLLSIWVGIARENPAAADRMYDRLAAKMMILVRYPEAGPVRRDIAADARMLVEAPYLILYRQIPDGVQVVRVLHGARNIDASVFRQGVE